MLVHSIPSLFGGATHANIDILAHVWGCALLVAGLEGVHCTASENQMSQHLHSKYALKPLECEVTNNNIITSMAVSIRKCRRCYMTPIREHCLHFLKILSGCNIMATSHYC